MARVMHFEIPAEDPKATMEFYENVFGWKFQKWGDQQYWMTSTGEAGEPGIEGAIKPKDNPTEGVVNTIGVASVDEVMGKIEASGGKLLTPKMLVPGVGWLVYFLDRDGHQFGAIEPDPSVQ